MANIKKYTLNLNAKNRHFSQTIDREINRIEIRPNRTDCKDILLEIIDKKGNAKGTTLNKCLPQLICKEPV